MGVANLGFWSHFIFVSAACGAACWGRPRNSQTDATSTTLPRCEGSWEGQSQGCGGRAGVTVMPVSLSGKELFDDPSYVNVQNLDRARQAGGGAGPPNPAINGSVPRDLFDMSECFSLHSASLSSYSLGSSPCVLLFPSRPSLPESLGLGVCCASCLSGLSLNPQSPSKMRFGCLHLPRWWTWLSSSEGSPGSMGS